MQVHVGRHLHVLALQQLHHSPCSIRGGGLLCVLLLQSYHHLLEVLILQLRELLARLRALGQRGEGIRAEVGGEHHQRVTHVLATVGARGRDTTQHTHLARVVQVVACFRDGSVVAFAHCLHTASAVRPDPGFGTEQLCGVTQSTQSRKQAIQCKGAHIRAARSGDAEHRHVSRHVLEPSA